MLQSVADHMLGERIHSMAALLKPLYPLSRRTVFEIGAAMGSNVPHLITLGFLPENIVINDIAAEKIAYARTWLPPGVRTVVGDAAALADGETFDVVVAATVFTSVISDAHRERLAERMWRLAARGGGVFLYDFTWNNPWNRAVRKLTLRDIRRLFPEALMSYQRVTLAPPLARHVSFGLYGLLQRVPALRTHVACWLAKQ